MPTTLNDIARQGGHGAAMMPVIQGVGRAAIEIAAVLRGAVFRGALGQAETLAAQGAGARPSLQGDRLRQRSRSRHSPGRQTGTFPRVRRKPFAGNCADGVDRDSQLSAFYLRIIPETTTGTGRDYRSGGQISSRAGEVGGGGCAAEGERAQDCFQQRTHAPACVRRPCLAVTHRFINNPDLLVCFYLYPVFSQSLYLPASSSIAR